VRGRSGSEACHGGKRTDAPIAALGHDDGEVRLDEALTMRWDDAWLRSGEVIARRERRATNRQLGELRESAGGGGGRSKALKHRGPLASEVAHFLTMRLPDGSMRCILAAGWSIPVEHGNPASVTTTGRPEMGGSHPRRKRPPLPSGERRAKFS